MSKIFRKTTQVDWTPINISFKAGGANLELGHNPLPHDTFFAAQAITAKMSDGKTPFLQEDKAVLQAICRTDGLLAKQPTLVIDPTKIEHGQFDSPGREDIPLQPWSTLGGSFLFVLTICVKGYCTENSGLEIYHANLFYVFNTFNFTNSYLNLYLKNGGRISNSGHCDSGKNHQQYYQPLAELSRDQLLGHDTEWFMYFVENASRLLPDKITAIASVG